MVVLLVDPDRDSIATIKPPGRFRLLALDSLAEVERSIRSSVGSGIRILSIARRLEDIIGSRTLLECMSECSTAFTCCFSCSYVAGPLKRLARMGFDIVGTCYLYDNMGSDCILVDHEGILMARDKDSRDRALVEWPSSKGGPVKYSEPIVTTKSFVPLLAVPFTSVHKVREESLIKVLGPLHYILKGSLRNALTTSSHSCTSLTYL